MTKDMSLVLDFSAHDERYSFNTSFSIVVYINLTGLSLFLIHARRSHPCLPILLNQPPSLVVTTMKVNTYLFLILPFLSLGSLSYLLLMLLITQSNTLG